MNISHFAEHINYSLLCKFIKQITLWTTNEVLGSKECHWNEIFCLSLIYYLFFYTPNLSCMGKEKEGLLENVSSFIYVNEVVGAKRFVFHRGKNLENGLLKVNRHRDYRSFACLGKYIHIRRQVRNVCVWRKKNHMIPTCHCNFMKKRFGQILETSYQMLNKKEPIPLKKFDHAGQWWPLPLIPELGR